MVATSSSTSKYERLDPDSSYPFGKWSPRFILCLFLLLSFLVYFDRGALAGCISDIQDDFDINNSMGGLVGGGYLLFYCVFSPIFAHLGNSYPPLNIAAIGMFLWCVGVAGTGLVFDFWTLLIARVLTGLGEASFMCMASTVIDFVAPSESRSTWLSIFYVAIPAGYAAGNGVSTGVATSNLFGWEQSWRLTFFGCGMLGLCSVLTLKIMDGPRNMLELDPNLNKEDDSVFVKVKKLLDNMKFVLITLGYASQTFVVGGLTYWTIKYFEEVYDMEETAAGSLFGGVSFVCGMLGSIAGGVLLDKLKGDTVSTKILLSAALKIIIPSSVIAFVAGCIAFQVHNLYILVVCLVIAEFTIFATVGPINNTALWVLPLEERPFGMAMVTFVIHLIGDAPAPFIIGAFADMDSLGWRGAMAIGGLWLGPPILCFTLVYILVSRMEDDQPDKNRESVQNNGNGGPIYVRNISPSEENFEDEQSSSFFG